MRYIAHITPYTPLGSPGKTYASSCDEEGVFISGIGFREMVRPQDGFLQTIFGAQLKRRKLIVSKVQFLPQPDGAELSTDPDNGLLIWVGGAAPFVLSEKEDCVFPDNKQNEYQSEIVDLDV